jgi:N-hydroxyarylamine O-acetyltransferase
MTGPADAPAAFDLDAYLRRIAYDGARMPTLDTLREIHRRHVASIAFENLDPLLRRPVQLDAGSLQRKLVDGGRGGWCYEQNNTLRHALDALGFRTTGLAARVVWNRPPGVVTPRTHMLLRVDLDQPWIVDAGFGGLTLTGPLRLVPDVEQATPNGPFRLAPCDDGFELQARLGDDWTPLYRFDLQPQQLADYALVNWYLSHHPQSHFLNGLMVARTDAGGRYTLRDNVLTVRHADGHVEARTLDSPAALRAALETEFRLVLPDGPELDAVLARFTTPA